MKITHKDLKEKLGGGGWSISKTGVGTREKSVTAKVKAKKVKGPKTSARRPN